ncbi:MAG: 30S ribosomal protein S15 [Phycisphaerales bacterium]|jgi:small subunit ribosomal protein S15|nr:30S ribosomal protein S15 [Phycisphaerales bacterium]NUQ67158.1 30S ribosomal protein S15 [Phycisphaerales bacterium]
MAITAERRKQVVETARIHDKDTGSPEVQVSMLTTRINEVAEHLRTNKKDHHSRRGLLMMVGRRNRLLRYLARTGPERYQGLIVRLGLRK